MTTRQEHITAILKEIDDNDEAFYTGRTSSDEHAFVFGRLAGKLDRLGYEL